MSNIPPYQRRAIDEHALLSEKITKLRNFVDSISFHTYRDEDERNRMCAQLVVMSTYGTILAARIAAFPKETT